MADLQGRIYQSRRQHPQQHLSAYFNPNNFPLTVPTAPASQAHSQPALPLVNADHQPTPVGNEYSCVAPLFQTCPSTPVKPSQRVDSIDERVGSRQSTQGGISLSPCYTAQRTGTNTPSQSPAAPVHSSNVANVGRRRMERTSMLLQSPARPGHTSRMKEIFDEIGEGFLQAQSSGVVVYPQLPNVGRATLPQPEQPRSRYGKFAESVSHQTGIQVLPSSSNVLGHCSQPSSHSSGSWSDDSGYIRLDSSDRVSVALAGQETRILDWLSTISATDNPSLMELKHLSLADDIFELTLPSEASNSLSARDRSRGRSEAPAHWYCPQARPSMQNIPISGYSELPFLRERRHVSDVCKNLDLVEQEDRLVMLTKSQPNSADSPLLTSGRDMDVGGIELAPLSPNVCIERGSARRRAANQGHSSELPAKLADDWSCATPTAYARGRAKENVG